MTTLCPSWALQLSRICLTCTPCKYRCQAQLLAKIKLSRCVLKGPCFIYSNPCFDLYDFALRHHVCFRMLRGASMMQDFPILTWTNNLESLWVNSDVALVPACVFFGVSEINLFFSFPGPCQEPRYRPSPLIFVRIWSCFGHCERPFLSRLLE